MLCGLSYKAYSWSRRSHYEFGHNVILLIRKKYIHHGSLLYSVPSTHQTPAMLNGSIQSRALKQQQIPRAQLLRPIPPVLDQKKIDSMVQTLRGETPDFIPSPAPESITPGELPPVDVLHYRSPAGSDYYFVFGGCHRMQAYDRLNAEMVNCKVIKVTKNMLKVRLRMRVYESIADGVAAVPWWQC